MGMHHGKLNGERMSNLLAFLKQNPDGVTGLDIVESLGYLNPATEISGLRHALAASMKPVTVAPAELVEVSRESGAKTYRYKLVFI